MQERQTNSNEMNRASVKINYLSVQAEKEKHPASCGSLLPMATGSREPFREHSIVGNLMKERGYAADASAAAWARKRE